MWPILCIAKKAKERRNILRMNIQHMQNAAFFGTSARKYHGIHE